MAKKVINISSPNDGNGDTLRNAFSKTNDNFDELYNAKDGIRSISTGGTGATTASGARTNLGVAYGTTSNTVLEGSKDAEYAKLTGNQTIAGVKTYTSSPIVPTPTTDLQVATKKYVDDNAGGGGGISNAFNVYLGTNYSVTNTMTKLPLNTEEIDSGSNYNTGTYLYTVPTTGDYFIYAQVNEGAGTSGDIMRMSVYKNVTVPIISSTAVLSTGNTTLTTNRILSLTAGDTIQLSVVNFTASRGTLVSQNDKTFFGGYKLN